MDRHDDKAVLCFFGSSLILIAIIFIFIHELTLLFQFLCVVLLFGFFFRLVWPVLPVYLDCPILIAPSILSNVYSETCSFWFPFDK